MIWKTETIGKLLIKSETVNPTKKADKFFKYIDVSSVDRDTLSIREVQQLLGKDAPSRARRLVRQNDVIFATVRPTLKRIAIVPDEYNNQVCSTGYIVLRPDSENLNFKYLFYFMQSDKVMREIEAIQTGASYPAVTDAQVRGLVINYPPLPVQKQIVEKLDAAFADIDKALVATQKNIENAEALCRRILFDIFEGKNAVRSTSTVGEIADHCLGKMLDKNKNKGNFQPYLRNTNVQWFSVNTDDMLLMKFEPEEKERFSVKKGDLLICEGGYPGRAAIWNNEDAVYFQKALHRVRCKDSIYNKWLMYYLYYFSSTNKLARYFTGSGIQHFTGKSLKHLPVPIPSIHETNSHVDMLDSLFEQIKHVNNIYSKKISLHEKLKSSLLNQAFSGELTKDAA